MAFFTFGSYALYAFFLRRNSDEGRFQVSISRNVSRFAGFVMSSPIPTSLRSPIYGKFASMYGVKLDEMKIEDLSAYKTFKDFFTRELKEGVRTISEKDNPSAVTSPCDGTVYSMGTVENSTMLAVKGNPYSVDEFMFGEKAKKGSRSYYTQLAKSAEEQGKELKFMVIYLSPGDYHRYHSAADFLTNYRRHVPGYLEPVKPSYIARHKDVFKDNERVTIFGDWSQGYFSMSFVGALNVGSMSLNFDPEMVTNRSNMKVFSDKKYSLHGEFD